MISATGIGLLRRYMYKNIENSKDFSPGRLNCVTEGSPRCKHPNVGRFFVTRACLIMLFVTLNKWLASVRMCTIRPGPPVDLCRDLDDQKVFLPHTHSRNK